MVRWLRWHCPPDTGFEIRALAVWGRARYFSVTEAPHNTNFHTWMGKKHFCFFQTAETGNRTPDSGVKGSGANHYPRAPAQSSWKKIRSESLRKQLEKARDKIKTDFRRLIRLIILGNFVSFSDSHVKCDELNVISDIKRLRTDKNVHTASHAAPCGFIQHHMLHYVASYNITCCTYVASYNITCCTMLIHTTSYAALCGFIQHHMLHYVASYNITCCTMWLHTTSHAALRGFIKHHMLHYVASYNITCCITWLHTTSPAAPCGFIQHNMLHYVVSYNITWSTVLVYTT